MTELTFEPMRRAMVASQLRTTGVNDPRVVAAMGEVERERFVPAERGALAYADAIVPLANGRALEGPLAAGWAEGSPYDFLLIDGAVEYVPQAIVDQAADGGRIALALLDRGVTRLGIGRVVSGAFGLSTVSDAAVAILPGFEKPREFVF